MEREQFTEFAKEMIRYIVDYKENIRDRKVLSSVKPGYLRPLIPDEAPVAPEKWQDIMADIERVIMPGVSHWHSPRFHAYYPTANSYPSIVADMLSDGIGCIGFSWISSPACTELEIVMLDWLGQMLDLPKEFLSCSEGTGGGVILGSASEGTLMALFAARARTTRKMKALHPEWSDFDIMSKLVAYTSELAHSGVERAGLLGGIPMRCLPVNERFELTAETLQEAIIKDKEAGLIPFYLVATLGTTSLCSFDPLDKIGPVCQKEDLWLHIDAAYAGSAFICPEFRKYMKGIEYADSLSTNPNKWMLVTFDCSTFWLKDPSDVVYSFHIDEPLLSPKNEGSVPDYRHWQIAMGRRFRSLKMWFVMRLYGVENLRAYIRKHVKLAHEFESYVNEDPRFEIIGEVTMGLVCFRLKGSNEINEKLVKTINGNGKIFLVPSRCHGIYFLRFSVSSRIIESSDIKYSWEEIKSAAAYVLSEHEN